MRCSPLQRPILLTRAKCREEAINAVTALCQCEDFLEEKISWCRRAKVIGEGVNGHDEVTGTKSEPMSIPIECLPTRCIFCLGKATSVSRSARVPSAREAT